MKRRRRKNIKMKRIKEKWYKEKDMRNGEEDGISIDREVKVS